MTITFGDLETVIRNRLSASPEESYVAKLNDIGLNKILEKVGEECTETILAAKDFSTDSTAEKRASLVGEVADLWFHSLVMLSHLDVDQCDIMKELDRRFGRSAWTKKLHVTIN